MAYDIVDSALPWVASSFSVIGYGNGKFVAARSFSTNAAVSTDNGATWTPSTRPSASQAVQLAYGNGVFVIVTGSSTVHVTPDGVNWISRTLPATGNWTSIAFGNGRFVAISDAGRSAWSLDGETWTLGTPVFSPTFGWSYVGFNGNLFVTSDSTDGAQNEYVYTSADGATWTQQYATLQIPADVYHSDTDTEVLYTDAAGITKAVGGTPTWSYTAFTSGQALGSVYSTTQFFDTKYINCEKPSTTRFRVSANIADATYIDAGNSYSPSNNKACSATGDTAVLFLVQDGSANYRVLGLANNTPIPPTQFWESLVGTTQY